MSMNTMMSNDLPGIYAATADTTATYNGKDINVFYEKDYEVEGMGDKTIKALTSDVDMLVVSEPIVLDSKSYTVLNFDFSDDGLETIIALKKV